MAEPVGVGVLGTGIMGRRMLAALHKQDRLAAVALWDPSAAALQLAQPLAPQATLHASAAALVADPAVQLVYIASPPSLHAQAVHAALAAGRACLCEKPLTHDLAEARALVAAVEAAGLPFAVNFPFASSTPARRLQQIVAGGELGDLLGAQIRLRFARWPREWQAGASAWLAGPAEGGFAREVLSHFVFLALRCFGPARVEGVQLLRQPGQAETALQCRLVHAGVTVEVDAAVAGDVADDNRFQVCGSRGELSLSRWSSLQWQGQTLEQSDGGPQMLQAFADWLQGRGPQGLATVQEAAAVAQVIEAILATDP